MSHRVHTMQALRFSEFGEPAVVLHNVQMPRPVPGRHEVLVRVEAAAINPSDVKNVQGAMRGHTSLPRTPGRDFAGTIVEGPSEFLDKAVWGTGGDLGFSREGTHAEYISLPIAAVGARPDRLSAAEAAAVGVGYITAWIGLIERAELEPGETVLVIGGGAVGSAVAQIARWKGAGKILMAIRAGADGSISAADPTVDAVIDLSRGDLAESAKAQTQGKGVSIAFNTVGGPLFGAGLHALAPGGRMVIISAPVSDPTVHLNALEFYRQEYSLFGVNTLHQSAVDSVERLSAMAPGFESGALTAPDVETYPLLEAVAAYEEVKAGRKAKIVLRL